MAEHQEMLLEQLNRFTKRTHTLDEVYLFDLILCDNEIDRDGDCFSEAALKSLEERFVGVTGIFDHNPKSGNQTARIFRTELCADPERKTKTGAPYLCLRANAYMVRTDGNADLIREIDAGIKKEVSISCAVGKKVCSVCGNNRLQKPCTHLKGRTYAGTKCYNILDDVTDAYEWSFVAVPAQRHAGVTKTLGGNSDAEVLSLRAALDHTCGLLDKMTEELRREVIRLCYRNGENACANALADSTEHLDAERLLELKESLLTGISAQNTQPQLTPHPQTAENPRMQAFRIGGAVSSQRG